MHVTNSKKLKDGVSVTCDSIESLRDKTLKLRIAVRLSRARSDIAAEMWAVVN